MNKPWIGDLTNSAVNAYQAADLPSNTQTAYNFTLNYDEGKLIGMVNIKQNYADPTKQQVTQDKLEEITFVKQDENFYAALKNVYDNQPDILKERIGAFTFNYLYVDKHGMKVSNEDVYTKMLSVDADLAKRYKKIANREKTCGILSLTSLGLFSVGLPLAIFGYDEKNDAETAGIIGICATGTGIMIGMWTIPISMEAAKERRTLVVQYNNQLTQRRNKPVSELRFGITPTGGVGLTMNF
jgi:hypothetical protein